MARLDMARLWLTFICLALVFPASGVAKDKIPSAQEGYADSVVFNGHQNMPVIVYGIARDWDKACFAKNAKACVQLAEAFELGLGDLVQDQRIALGYFKKACEFDQAAACARAAQIVNAGEATFKNPALAKTFGARGCALNSKEACAAQAEAMMSMGEYDQGLSLAVATCNAKIGEACRLVARHRFNRANDYAGAIALADTACAEKQAWGCNIMVEAYTKGQGVPFDKAKAFTYAEKGCVQSQGERLPACRDYGIALVNDRQDVNSWKKGESFLDITCTALDALACREIGKLGLRGGAVTTLGEGIFYLRRACDLKDAVGCSLLAKIYDTGAGNLPSNQGVAFKLLQRACHLYEVYCGRAKTYGEEHPVARDTYWLIDPSLPVAEQLVLAQQEVNSGVKVDGVMAVIRLMYEQNEYAEWLLGGWMYYGLDGVFGTERKQDGVTLIENAARVGHEDALIWIGMAYWYGNDVPLDRPKGENYMLIAAERGSEKAAAIYRSMKLEPWREEQARRSKEFEEAQARMAEAAKHDWTLSWNNYSNYYANASGSTYQSSNSVSSIMDQHNWNNAMNHYSGYTSYCAPSNPYC